MSLATLTLAMTLCGAAPLPDDVSAINFRKFEIPMQFNGNKDNIREVILFVSRGKGTNWEQHAVNPPTAAKFPYFAAEDGMYWFQLMIVDKNGRRDPPDLYKSTIISKILVDTQRPAVRIKSADRKNDEVSVAWDITEMYPDLATFKLEYAPTKADGTLDWQTVPVKAALVGQTKFRVTVPGPIRMKLTLLDTATNEGNVTKEVAGSGSAPGPVSGPALTSFANATNATPNTLTPIPNPPAPTDNGLILPPSPPSLKDTPPLAPVDMGLTLPNLDVPAPMPTPMPTPKPQPMAQPAPMVMQPMTIAVDTPIGSSQRPPAPMPTPALTPAPMPQPAPMSQPQPMNPVVPVTNNAFEPSTPAPNAAIAAPANDPTTSGAAPIAVSNGNSVATTASNLPALQVVNITKFDLNYTVEEQGPSGISRAELWVTRDDGRTWICWTVDDDKASPIHVELDTKNNQQLEGIYGFKIVLVSGAGLSKGQPISGDLPDMRIELDIAQPIVTIYPPIPHPTQRDILTIRWEAVDRNLAAEPITLEYSETPDGPWRPIVSAAAPTTTNDRATLGVSATAGGSAKRIANLGSYAWRLPTNMPTHRVYLRITARDNAGNLAEARTPQPIEVDLNKPIAKISGILGAQQPRR